MPADCEVRRSYIRFQLFIWGFVCVLSLVGSIWDTSPVELKPYIVGLRLFGTLLTAVCSHFMWLAARRYKWIRKKHPSARRMSVFRWFGVCVLIATVVVAITTPFAIFIHNAATRAGVEQLSMPMLLAGNWLGTIFLLVLWWMFYAASYLGEQNRRLETERAQLLAATREAQLMALRGQINPHFLFNSLNTLRALIQSEPLAARAAVTHLADMMRYSLTMSGHSVIPLATELDFVNDYLALERLRYEERLRVRKNIQPEALLENIPPMLVQTLVENAVKHGIRQRAGGIIVTCDIRIEPAPKDAARGAPSQLRLRVTNQGRIEPSNSRIAARDDTRTGLRNTRERLALLYGGRASLTLEQQDGLVVAEAVIPIEPARNDAANNNNNPVPPPPDDYP